MTIGLGEHHNVQAMAAVLEREASCNKCNTRKHPKAPVEGSIDGLVVESDGNLDTSEDDEDEESKEMLADFKLCFPHLKRAGLKIRGKELRPTKLVKNVKMITIALVHFKIVQRNRCFHHDNYFDGPTIEDMHCFNTDREGWQPGLIYGKHKPTFRSRGHGQVCCWHERHGSNGHEGSHIAY